MNTKELAAVLEGMDVVDLTLTMEEGMPVWPTHQHFYHNIVESTEMGDPATHYCRIVFRFVPRCRWRRKDVL